MSTRENQNMRKRVDALESRLMATERAQRAESTRAVGWNWPRDTWLGRTTSDSPSSYPTSGDTFQVELLTGYFTAAEGTQAVTESLRGTKPIARTWPATYLPYGTEVIAHRMRGTGPSGAGEWWIQPSGDTAASAVVQFQSQYGLDELNASTRMLRYSGSFPGLAISFPPTPNSYFEVGLGTSRDHAALTCLVAGRYLLFASVEWLLYSIPDASYSDMQLSYFVAPSGTTYPVFSRYGAPQVRVSSGLDILPAGLGARNINPAITQMYAHAVSRAPVRPTGGSLATSSRSTQIGSVVATLDVGDRIFFRVAPDHDYVAPPSYVGSWYEPQTDLSLATLQAVYCGDATNV